MKELGNEEMMGTEGGACPWSGAVTTVKTITVVNGQKRTLSQNLSVYSITICPANNGSMEKLKIALGDWFKDFPGSVKQVTYRCDLKLSSKSTILVWVPRPASVGYNNKLGEIKMQTNIGEFKINVFRK